ncbi:hypothetical protein LHFGNBLO_006457 (plasmid) [Mesorhizobium sp. AR10]|nr:hypothetical protein LHFGNBLO_006457 [Mesorhizobium sp. AR10]
MRGELAELDGQTPLTLA